jgi:hypothetical protein
MRVLRALTILVLAAGCVGDPGADNDLCDTAAAHIAACTGAAAAESWGSCEGDAVLLAQHALSTSCDQMAVGGKADGFSSGAATLICIGLAVPIFAHGLEEDAACCFDHNCEGALVCRRFSCEKKSGMGGPCERLNHCQDGLACKAGKCGTPVAQGGACDKTDACAEDLVCDAAKRCNPPAAEGKTCKTDEHCASFRCEGGKCATESDEGGVCGVPNKVCGSDLVCENGLCADPPASGKVCDRDDRFGACPMNETCWDDTCERQHGEGGPCADLFDCEFGLFCRSGACKKLN